MSFPAFKEWHVIVEALGAGEQILILRKGGIAESRLGFEVEAPRCWLFPTRFHAQLEKTKPRAAQWFDSTSDVSAPSSVTLRYFADIVSTTFLSDWEKVRALDPFHLWTEATVRERFDYGGTPGLHALVVRVHRLETALTLPLSAEMGGCKSWIELPQNPLPDAATPVLSAPVFAARLAALSL